MWWIIIEKESVSWVYWVFFTPIKLLYPDSQMISQVNLALTKQRTRNEAENMDLQVVRVECSKDRESGLQSGFEPNLRRRHEWGGRHLFLGRSENSVVFQLFRQVQQSNHGGSGIKMNIWNLLRRQKCNEGPPRFLKINCGLVVTRNWNRLTFNHKVPRMVKPISMTGEKTQRLLTTVAHTFSASKMGLRALTTFLLPDAFCTSPLFEKTASNGSSSWLP